MKREFLIFFTTATTIFINEPIQAFNSFTSEQALLDVDQQILSNEERSLLYTSCGYSNLISKNYQDAFEDYQKALLALSNSTDSGMEFLISFGMVVACDNLNLIIESRQHILKIRDLIDGQLDDELEDRKESTSQANQEMISRLMSLANMSPSAETQKILVTFISEIFPSTLAAYSNSCLDSANNYNLPITRNPKAILCKSFWKKVEDLAKKIAKTWDKLYKIYKEVREVEDDIRARFSSATTELV